MLWKSTRFPTFAYHKPRTLGSTVCIQYSPESWNTDVGWFMLVSFLLWFWDQTSYSNFLASTVGSRRISPINRSSFGGLFHLSAQETSFWGAPECSNSLSSTRQRALDCLQMLGALGLGSELRGNDNHTGDNGSDNHKEVMMIVILMMIMTTIISSCNSGFFFA